MKTITNYINEKANFIVKKHVTNNNATPTKKRELKVGDTTIVSLVACDKERDWCNEDFEVTVEKMPSQQINCNGCALEKSWVWGGSICRPDDGTGKYGCKIIYPEQIDKYGEQDRPCHHGLIFKTDKTLFIET